MSQDEAQDRPGFTPGPWEEIGSVVRTERGLVVADMYVSSWGIPRVEQEANAHLIAAAPEMYEALRLFVEAEPGHDWSGSDPLGIERQAIDAARAAIAKATADTEADE